MKRIAFINFDMSDTGGSQQVLSNLVNAMDTEYDIHVISLIQERENWAYSFEEQVHCQTIIPYKARIRETIFKGKKALVRYLRENRIELVFYVGAYAGLCASVMARRVRCKKVFCDHGALMNQWKELPARIMRTMGSRFSDRTVVLTKQSEEAYYEKFHYRRGRVLTIYNWMDERILKDAKEYDRSSLKLLTAGRFSHEKGYDLLVTVAEKLREKIPDTDWEWDIYGQGDMFDEIQQKLAERNLLERVHLHGLTDKMSQCYRGHALYVLTSYREGLPLVLIEAKANRLPIVSFDIVSGPAEIVSDGENGVLIPAYDTDKMATVLAALLTDEKRRIEMSEKSTQRMQFFQKEEILRQWNGLIEELTN
jgi:glycosyltransferase involved in cell wall biosynthesis